MVFNGRCQRCKKNPGFPDANILPKELPGRQPCLRNQSFFLLLLLIQVDGTAIWRKPPRCPVKQPCLFQKGNRLISFSLTQGWWLSIWPGGRLLICWDLRAADEARGKGPPFRSANLPARCDRHPRIHQIAVDRGISFVSMPQNNNE